MIAERLARDGVGWPRPRSPWSAPRPRRRRSAPTGRRDLRVRPGLARSSRCSPAALAAGRAHLLPGRGDPPGAADVVTLLERAAGDGHDQLRRQRPSGDHRHGPRWSPRWSGGRPQRRGEGLRRGPRGAVTATSTWRVRGQAAAGARARRGGRHPRARRRPVVTGAGRSTRVGAGRGGRHDRRRETPSARPARRAVAARPARCRARRGARDALRRRRRGARCSAWAAAVAAVTVSRAGGRRTARRDRGHELTRSSRESGWASRHGQAPGRVAADEADQPVLRGGVVGDRHPWAVLARGAQQLVDRLHAGEQLGAEVGVEGVVLAGGAGEVPGVHEDVGRVEPVDRRVERQLAGVRVREHRARRGRVVEHRLHGVGVGLPGDRPGRRRPTARRAAGCRCRASRKPGNHSTRCRTTSRAAHSGTGVGASQSVAPRTALGEAAGDGPVPLGRVACGDAAHSSPASSRPSSAA